MKAICVGGPAAGKMADYDGDWFDYVDHMEPLALMGIQSTRPEYESLKYTSYKSALLIYNGQPYWIWVPLKVKNDDVEGYVFKELFENYKPDETK